MTMTSFSLLVLLALHSSLLPLLMLCSGAPMKIKTTENHDGGFCSLSPTGHFPRSPPKPHIPWIWDATVSRSGRMVEATAISRNACRFDLKLWREIVDAYPQYAHQLGQGLTSSILAPVVPGYDYVRANPHGGYKGERKRGLQMRTVVCVFLLRGVEVARGSSLRILDVEIAELSSIQIRCPIPDHLNVPPSSPSSSSSAVTASWDSMRIERRLSPHPEHKEIDLPNSTEIFSVCNMHRLVASQPPSLSACHPGNRSSCTGSASASASGKGGVKLQHLRQGQPPGQSRQSGQSLASQHLYKLSLCTASARASRSRLVEWIEYHKLLGVEHFYLYDTSPRDTPAEKTIRSVLADYVHSGLLTVVRWPYENCVRGMGSGRKVIVSRPFQATFSPPRAIAQTGALASCYSRHKEFSEWMIHIDDDEFLAFSPTAKFGPGTGVKVQSLYELVSQIAKKDPLTNAVSFFPLCVTDCSRDGEGVDKGGGGGGQRRNVSWRRTTVLPRYGLWNKGKFCPYYETKLVMRTAAIGMFFTHYITLRETANYNREPTQLSRRDAAVLHFKDIHNLEASGSIFGATLPVDPHLKTRECRLIPDVKENVTAARVLDTLTKLALPYLERNYVSQLTEINAFEM